MRLMRLAAILGTVGLGAGTLVFTQGRSQPMVDITATGPNGLPIIFWRIEQDDRDAVRALISAGMDIEIKGFQQATPALAAATANAWITTEMLLQMGADPTASNRLGFTLPWLAGTAVMPQASAEGKAQARVRADLAARGLMDEIYEPAQVKALRDKGRWPPQ